MHKLKTPQPWEADHQFARPQSGAQQQLGSANRACRPRELSGAAERCDSNTHSHGPHRTVSTFLSTSVSMLFIEAKKEKKKKYVLVNL